MYPVLAWLDVQGQLRPIGSYGVMLACAFLVALGAMALTAHRARLDVGAAMVVTAGAAGGALIGGWSLFVLVEWLRTGTPAQALRQGGLVFFGAAVGGFLGFALLARLWRQPRGALLDAAVLPLGLAHALGRLGCLFAGCCYGEVWSGWGGFGWGAVTYTHPLAPAAHIQLSRHPVPLYEALGALVLGVMLHRLALRRARRGEPGLGAGRWFCAYFALYAVLRFALEPLRADVVRGFLWEGGLSTSQALAVGVWVLSCWGWVRGLQPASSAQWPWRSSLWPAGVSPSGRRSRRCAS